MLHHPDRRHADLSLEARLESTVRHLAAIGPRNIRHLQALRRASRDIEASLAATGSRTGRQEYEARETTFSNIIAEVAGHAPSPDIIVVGAHYDSHKESPGANDNGSGVAILIELARAAAMRRHAQSLRFVAFTNEESPFTRTNKMGSYVYAQACRKRGDRIRGMLCLETLGCYSEKLGSQRLSFGGLLLPRQGNFLALVGNPRSKRLLTQVAAALARGESLRVEPWILPEYLPGARSSDQWSFWKHGFPAVMATDTAPLRYRAYHRRDDTPDKLDFVWLARVTKALDVAVNELANTA